jgi:hypothetical protein
MASAAGVAYETSVQAARRRGIVEVWVERYDASKTTIGAHPPDLPRRRAGAADADELGGALSLIGAAAIVAGSTPT